jgi:hypothetical protein
MNDNNLLDLILLVPGKDEQEALDGLLSSRRPSLRIRPIRYTFLVASMRDPGCFQSAHALLRPYHNRVRRAVVIFDHFGSGQEHRVPEEVEENVRSRLSAAGWGDRAEALVLRPELETWVWSASPHVDEVLGWRDRNPPLREWLRDRALWPVENAKPPQPKKSLLEALRQAGVPQSPRLFRQLANRVGIHGCQDATFVRFRELLHAWFPEAQD